MTKQTPPFSVVLLTPIAEHPIHALVSPSGDSILLSQDTKVSTLVNTPELIAEVLGTYDQFLINNKIEFKLLTEVVLDLPEEKIFPKVYSDLLEDSLFIIRGICSFKANLDDANNANAMRATPKEISEESIMKKAVDHSMLLEKLMLDLSSNIERLQS
ncbi:hypothetical protein [Acinetobacter sp. YH01009]|uniref:hypothetical protein n=1 Tax=Acinetobacter TaxID=469 RepID=UPI0015D2B58F|nr:hypothetical protein [Acinetobacter sp. YH01009]